jgi:hypothetical protein
MFNANGEPAHNVSAVMDGSNGTIEATGVSGLGDVQI